jgi:acyl-CoA synthetase (AMP-forming)/AMP-acid ligase II
LAQLAAGDWITLARRRWPDAPCLVDADSTTWTFAETAAQVEGISRALLARGLRKGDRLAIVATDSPAHVHLVLACLRVGVVFCDLNFRLRAGELANIVAAAQPRAIVFERRYEALVDVIAGGPSSTVELRLRLDGDELAAGDGPPLPVHAAAHGEDIVSIAFTSGTTGVPKGVLQSERMIRNIVYSGVRELDIRPGGFRYAGAPLFHISGIGSVLYAIVGGCASLILPQFDAPAVLRWMQQGGLTYCLLIPTMISELLELPDATALGYPTLQSIMYGGAPMSPALLRRTIETFGCDLYNGFGAGTEAGGQTMLYPAEHRAAMAGKEHLLGSIGRPTLGVDLRLCDEHLRDVAPGEIGEIVTRSETVMSGYLDQPELTARSVIDGWFRAGDMAFMDAEGYLYLATRKADMIIRGGENVYPVEIESTLAEHPAVVSVAVVGVPDDHWGEIVAAALVVRERPDGLADELRAFCRERLASYKVPEVVEVFDELPRNSTGKLLKPAIADAVQRRVGDRAGGER